MNIFTVFPFGNGNAISISLKKKKKNDYFLLFTGQKQIRINFEYNDYIFNTF